MRLCLSNQYNNDMKYLLLIFMAFMVASPVYAQDDLAPEPTNLELAEQMHKIWPIRPKIEAIIDIISEDIAPNDRLRLKAALRQAIEFDALEDASIEAMAEIFTAEELEAMIDFYGSKEGRAVTFKVDDYERALEPTMTKMMDKALLDLKLGKQ